MIDIIEISIDTKVEEIEALVAYVADETEVSIITAEESVLVEISSGDELIAPKAPVLFQYSVDGLTGWHPVPQLTDVYLRKSIDNGATYGGAVPFNL